MLGEKVHTHPICYFIYGYGTFAFLINLWENIGLIGPKSCNAYGWQFTWLALIQEHKMNYGQQIGILFTES